MLNDPDIARREIHHIIEPSVKEPSVGADASPLSLFSESANPEKKPKNNRKPQSAKKPPSPATLDSILEELKPIYPWVDTQTEKSRITGWLLARPHRKLTKTFVVNWLNRIDPPLSNENGQALDKYLAQRAEIMRKELELKEQIEKERRDRRF